MLPPYFYFYFPVKTNLENNSVTAESTTNLPNYGNVDLTKVFASGDFNLVDKDYAVNYIDQYYKKVWERGNLSGSFLVAQGDQVLYENYRVLLEKEVKILLIKIQHFMLHLFQKH
ncbi:hypothetical protein [Chryseobacterium indoltheticum]|uniref:hypothetical protein n=1 Tax=Chryseobacterium indoltheticum TaxID=254 RepID=UPI003F497A77